MKEKRQVGPGDAKIRQAFYAALKDLVRRTKSGRIAAAFMDAMSDVMVANFDDANWRQEIPTVERELRDVLLGEGAGSGALAQVRDEIDDALDEKTKLMDKDIHRSGVEVQYLKLYLGIKQAVEQVGEAWVAKKTRSRRDRVADLGTARTWVGRGINVAWSFCPGPSAAVPVVLAGTIADIFLESEAAAAQRELDRYEAALREALAANLAAKLGNITELAQTDFAALDAGVLPKLSRGIFQSLGDIEALYSAKLRTELDQAEVY